MRKALWSDRDGIGAMMVRSCDWTVSHLQMCQKGARFLKSFCPSAVIGGQAYSASTPACVYKPRSRTSAV